MRCWSESTNTFTAPRYPKDIPKISTKLPGQQVSNAIVEGSLSSRSLRLQVGWISHWKLWIWINIYIYIFFSIFPFSFTIPKYSIDSANSNLICLFLWFFAGEWLEGPRHAGGPTWSKRRGCRQHHRCGGCTWRIWMADIYLGVS